jgi:hypothetical protein
MKYFKIAFLFLVIIFVFSTCYYDKADLLYPSINNQCDTSNVTYQLTIQPLMSSYCLGCHSNNNAAASGGNIKLQDYASVQANIAKIYSAVSQQSGTSPMPKNSNKLSDCIITEIKIWKDKGAPNN